jgi:mRNA interferase MazF
VLSPDVINAHSPVVLIASITSKKTERVYPFEALVEPPEGGLTQRSKVLLMQLRAVDKHRLVGRYGMLSDATLEKVEEALKVATGLIPS